MKEKHEREFYTRELKEAKDEPCKELLKEALPRARSTPADSIPISHFYQPLFTNRLGGTALNPHTQATNSSQLE